jgi:hypothetical protein
MRASPRSLFAGRVIGLPVGVRAAAIGALVLVAGCSSTSAKEQATEDANATSLVSAAHAAGVAPDLTVGVAESLYGTSAPQICDVLKDGISSAESLLLTGNPSGRRGKLITTDTVTFERLVVKAYCSDELKAYDDLVADIDPTEKSD